MVIDANMYWFPEEIFENEEMLNLFLSEMPVEYGLNGYMRNIEDSGLKQIVIEKPRGFQNLNYVQGDYVLEQQLADMDKAGVEKAVLKLPGCHEWMGLETCKRFNDGMSAHAGKSGGRMVPLAVVPPYGKPECLKELERCRYELGMTGIQMCAHYGNYYLDHELFAPFFEKLNELEFTVYVHHTPVPVQHDMLFEYNNLRRSYGRCVDQTTAIGREMFSGFFERYPKLRMVHSMLGGGFFAIYNMMVPHGPKGKEKVTRFEAGSDEVKGYLKNNIFFEMSHAQPWGREQLQCAVSVLGADHILFGTSYPVKPEWLTEGADFVKALDISEEEKEMILSGNAKRLYRIA